MTVFVDYANYYDLIYKDKDYAGESAFVSKILREHGDEIGSIAELGCGTGQHACLLADIGYTVHGIDRSAGMVALAQQRKQQMIIDRASRISFLEADIRDYQDTRKFDAVISLFHVMSYQTSNDDIASAFATAKRLLRSGGIFLFDSWYGPAVIHQRPVPRVKRWQNEAMQVTRVAEPEWHPNENRVDVHYQLFMKDQSGRLHDEVEETHKIRYLFLPEVEHFLRDAGLSLIGHGEWMTCRALTADTWNAYFVARSP